MEKDLKSTEALKKLKELIEEVRICMFAVADSSNQLYGRPMTSIEVEDDGTIWFFTSDHNTVAQETAAEENVSLNYAHPGKNTYLTVQGRAALVKDKKKMEELWTPMLKAWFPKGLEEPDIALLKVTPDEAHYWDTDASKLVILFAMVRAAVTGKTSETGKYGELHLNK